MGRNVDPIDLNMQLYRRLVSAGLSCAGFTPLMKDDIAYIANMTGEEAFRQYGLPPFASGWRHQYALAPKPGMPSDVVEVRALLRVRCHVPYVD